MHLGGHPNDRVRHAILADKPLTFEQQLEFEKLLADATTA